MVSVGTHAVKGYIYVGIGVGRQGRCKTCQSLRKLDNHCTVFLFFFSLGEMTVIELDSTGRAVDPKPRTLVLIASRSVNLTRPQRGSCKVIRIAVSRMDTSVNKDTHCRCRS